MKPDKAKIREAIDDYWDFPFTEGNTNKPLEEPKRQPALALGQLWKHPSGSIILIVQGECAPFLAIELGTFPIRHLGICGRYMLQCYEFIGYLGDYAPGLYSS